MSNLHQVAALYSQRQGRVITTAQALSLGISHKWISHKVKIGVWQRLFRGVYLTHSGPLTWHSRAFGALLAAGPGAYLSHETAWYLYGLSRNAPQIISVSIPRARSVVKRPGIRVYRRRYTQMILGEPARTSLEETAVDLIAKTRDRLSVIGLLTDGIRKGMQPVLVLRAVEDRERYRHRTLVKDVLCEIKAGVESPLEHLYDELERSHGLPPSRKQHAERLNNRWTRADRVFVLYRVRVELDGELAHPGGRTNSDTWRDNANMVKSIAITLRYRWQHIAGTPCETAGQIAAALRSRGWRGEPKLCNPNCRVKEYQVA